MNLQKVALQNKGMSQDLSISKDGKEYAYENHNIRIQATDDGTLFSVTNIQGTKRILYNSEGIKGIPIAHCLADKYLVVFTLEYSDTGESSDDEDENIGTPIERIYRVNLESLDDKVNIVCLYEGEDGSLHFSFDTPIDTLYYYETAKTQKVYWTNGWKDNPRVINIVKEPVEGVYYINSNDLSFYPMVSKIPIIEVEKVYNNTSVLPAGVIQYFISFFNDNGAETLISNATSLYGIDKQDRGLNAETTTTNCSFKIKISNIDTSFDYLRIYSVLRTSYDGEPQAYIVRDLKIDKTKLSATYETIDNGHNNESIQVSQVIYAGGTPFFAKTLTQKDNVVFFGNIKTPIGTLDETVKEECDNTIISDLGDMAPSLENPGNIVESNTVSFVPGPNLYTDNNQFNAYYPYRLQNNLNPKLIKTFKARERYRFGLQFQDKQGVWSNVVWIGDKTQTLYPQTYINESTGKEELHLATAKFTMPNALRIKCQNAGYINYRLLMADPEFTNGRTIKAQGVLCPTLFNLAQRHINSPYALPSWIMRPRGGSAPYHHLEPLYSDLEEQGVEIQCDCTKNGNYLPPVFKKSEYCYVSFMCPRYGRHLFYAVFKIDVTGLHPEDNFYNPEDGTSELNTTNTIQVFCKYFSGETWGSYLDEIREFFTDSSNDCTDYPLESLPTVQELIKISNTDTGNDKVTFQIIKKSLLGKVSEDIEDYTEIHKKTHKAYAQRLSLKNWIRWTNTYRRNDLFANNASNASGQSSSLVEAGGLFVLPSRLNGQASNYSNIYLDNVYPGSVDNSIFVQCIYSNNSIKSNNQYYVDSSIVTMNSPEINENTKYNIDNGTNKVRIVGIVPFTSNYSDFAIETDPKGYLNTSGDINSELNYYRQTGGINPLYSDYLYGDSGFKKIGSNYYLTENLYKYKIFMWHQGGSIIGATENDFMPTNTTTENNGIEIPNIPANYSTLKTKTFYNHLFSSNTVYKGYREYTPSNIKYVDNNSIFLNNVEENSDDAEENNTFKIYRGEYDNILVLQNTDLIGEFGVSNILNSENNESKNYPSTIRIKFSTTPHAVFDLGSNNHGRFILPRRSDELPYLNASNSTYNIKQDINTEWGEKNNKDYNNLETTYQQQIVLSIHGENSINGFTPDITIFNNDSNDVVSEVDESLYAYPYLWLGEIYEHISNDRLYGGYNEEDLKKLVWIPISEPTPITSDIEHSEGDTYYQRWDCLKTYPTTEDDVNKVVDIASFMVETHINLDERVDANRANYNIMARPTNFNLFNHVYDQKNNIFSYTIVNDKLDSEIANSFTWSMAKNYGALVDSWTNTNLLSSGKCESAITKLVKYGQHLYALNEHSIELINFNEKNLVPTTTGEYIEVANSSKVDGTTDLTFPYGTYNNSVIITERGLYFIEDNEKCLICLTSEGPKKLGAFRMTDWMKNNIEQGTYTFNNNIPYHLEYDSIHKDIYLVNGLNCLVYNEILDSFTSFVDYSAMNCMFNYKGKVYSLGESSVYNKPYMYEMFSGNYNIFFDAVYPYWIKYRVNADSLMDKVFTNVEFISDVEDSININIPPFDIIKADNEHQDSGEIPLVYSLHNPSNLKRLYRIWRADIPRDNGNKLGGNRIRNPWFNLLLKRSINDIPNKKMIFHNLNVQYML